MPFVMHRNWDLALRLAVLLAGVVLSMDAADALAEQCGFTYGAVVAERVAPGIETMRLKREWRGMVVIDDARWVDFEVSASYPRFTREAFPAAGAINAELRKHIESDLAAVGECPEEARLPSRGTKLFDGRSDVGVYCETGHASRVVVSISCSTAFMTLLNVRPATTFEQFNFTVVDGVAKRLQTDDMFRGGAARKRLLAFIRDELEKQGATDNPSAFSDEEDLAGWLRAVIEKPKLAAGGIVFDFIPNRWTAYCVELPRSEWEWALTPRFFDRMTRHPSSVSGDAASCGE